MGQDAKIVAESVVVNNGLSVGGALTGTSLTAVSQLTASTGISITAGGLTVTGGATIDKIVGGTAAVQTLASSGAITVGAKVAKVTATAGAAITALSLTAGVAGQEIHVINENAVGASTLIISSGIIVTSGTTTVTISGLAQKGFLYDDTQSLWVAQ